MRQTPDGGYLVLGGRKLNESDFTGIYLLKADKFGNFVKEIEVDETSVNPIAKLTAFQSKYYFFCMDPITQVAQIADVDAELGAVTITPFKAVSLIRLPHHLLIIVLCYSVMTMATRSLLSRW